MECDRDPRGAPRPRSRYLVLHGGPQLPPTEVVDCAVPPRSNSRSWWRPAPNTWRMTRIPGLSAFVLVPPSPICEESTSYLRTDGKNADKRRDQKRKCPLTSSIRLVSISSWGYPSLSSSWSLCCESVEASIMRPLPLLAVGEPGVR